MNVSLILVAFKGPSYKNAFLSGVKKINLGVRPTLTLRILQTSDVRAQLILAMRSFP